MEGVQSWRPTLLADRAGTFRLRLSVTDAGGLKSRTADVVIHTRPSAAEGLPRTDEQRRARALKRH